MERGRWVGVHSEGTMHFWAGQVDGIVMPVRPGIIASHPVASEEKIISESAPFLNNIG